MPRPFSRAHFLLLPALLAACVSLGQGGGDKPAPAPAEEISVTALPPASGAGQAATVPAVPGTDEAATDTEEAATAEAAPAAAEPAVPTPEEAAPPPLPPSPEALACQRSGGAYVGTGTGSLKACVKPTGEGGKSCTRETDCAGVCLARSGTCAPVTPLFGCNEILQADGRRVTLCIE